MKRSIKYVQGTAIPVLLFGTMMLTGCGDVGEGDAAETTDAVDVEESNDVAENTVYAIDTAASSIGWYGARVAGSHDGGFNTFDGTVTVNGEAIEHVKVTIDMASVWSDNEKLTGHLMSPDFFEVETWPTSEFEASEFKAVNADTGTATHQVTGNLTMHGVTKGVSFPATVTVENGMVRAAANFIIDRQQWGIAYAGAPDDLVKDEVRITLDIIAGEQK